MSDQPIAQTGPVVANPAPGSQPVEPPLVLAAVGDAEDMLSRLLRVLPASWFGSPDEAPATLRLPLSMAAVVAAWLHGLIAHARRQTRLRSMGGGFLDLAAFDFFGTRIRRRQGQTDESLRARILVELFRPRGTRQAMAALLYDLTGMRPDIFEPSRPADTGAVGIASRMGVGVAGRVGSITLPGQVFITVFRRPDAGIARAAGVGAAVGGVGVASRLVVSSVDQVQGALTDRDIYSAINATRPAGIKVWARLSA